MDWSNLFTSPNLPNSWTGYLGNRQQSPEEIARVYQMGVQTQAAQQTMADQMQQMAIAKQNQDLLMQRGKSVK